MDNGTSQVTILRKIYPGLASGILSDGTELLVEHGDLCIGESKKVKVINGIGLLLELDYELESLEAEFRDKDGLIPTSLLIEHEKSEPFQRIFEIGGYWCFADSTCKKLIEQVIDTAHWSRTRIRISKARISSSSSARLFGVDLAKAIELAMRNGTSITRLFAADKKDWQTEGVFADYLIKINRSETYTVDFSGWQALGNDATLFYIHGIIDTQGSNFIHLDFAFHYTEIDEIRRLLELHSYKPELTAKRKIFRIDGALDMSQAFEMAKSFFPMTELVDEFYSREIH